MIRALERLLPRRWAGSIELLREHLNTPLFANAYLLILNQGMSAVLGLVYWVAAARIYSTDLTGRGSAIISTLGYVSALAELSLKSGMQRFVPRAGKHVGKLILMTYGVVLLASGILLAIFLEAGNLFNFPDNLLGDMNPNMLAFFVLATMCYTVFIVQDGVLLGLRQAFWVMLENTVFNVSKIVLLFVGVAGIFGNEIAASWFIPAPFVVLGVNVLVFVYFVPRYLRGQSLQASSIKPGLIVKSVSGDHIGTILSETSFRLLPLMIINLMGTSANAYFYQAWLIGNMLYLVSANVSSSFTVEAASDPDRIATLSRQSLRHSLTLVVLIMLALLIAAPLVLQIYGGEYASQGTPLLRWLALAAVPYALNSWFLSYSRVKANVKAIILTQGLQCGLTLGLSYWWMPNYGISSIGVAWLVAQLSISGMVVVMTRKILFSHESTREPVPVTENPAPVEQNPFATHSFTTEENVTIFLSPHLDDAVLSCGGIIARLAREGERVVIVTFFTRDLPAGRPVSWLARRNLRAWNMKETSNAFAMRRAEDQAAANRLAAETDHLGLFDAMYRCAPDGRPYYTRNTVGVPIDPEDEKQTGQALEILLRRIRDCFIGSGRLRWIAPLGMSQHVDHLLVRDQAQKVFGPEKLTYYEEFPYTARDAGWALPEIRALDGSERSWSYACLTLSQEEIQAWVDATACYISQVPGLFPLAVERTLEILYTRSPMLMKPLWELHGRSIQPTDLFKRPEQFFQEYLQRNGGMKLWNISAPGAPRNPEVENVETHP